MNRPLLAQATSWEYQRDYFLGPARDVLMRICANGRAQNAIGVSYRNPTYVAEAKRKLLASGVSSAYIDALQAGKASAMAQVCPSVWRGLSAPT